MVIKVSSAGYDAGNYAKITLNDVPLQVEMNDSKHYRGLHIVLINTLNCKVELAKVFDTYKSSDKLDQFIA